MRNEDLAEIMKAMEMNFKQHADAQLEKFSSMLEKRMAGTEFRLSQLPQMNRETRSPTENSTEQPRVEAESNQVGRGRLISENPQTDIHSQITDSSMKSEFHRDWTLMMEKVDLMINKEDEQKSKGEGKCPATTSIEITLSSEITPKTEEIGLAPNYHRRRDKQGAASTLEPTSTPEISTKVDEIPVTSSKPPFNFEIPPKIEAIELSKTLLLKNPKYHIRLHQLAFLVEKPTSDREYKGKDMSQTDFDHLEIELAEVEMPTSMSCRTDFGPSQPFKGAGITSNLHTAVLIEILRTMGAEVLMEDEFGDGLKLVERLTDLGYDRKMAQEVNQEMGLNKKREDGPIKSLPKFSIINWEISGAENKKGLNSYGDENYFYWEVGDPLGFIINSELEMARRTNNGQNYHETHMLSISYHCLPIHRVFLLENSRGGATGYGICMNSILMVVGRWATKYSKLTPSTVQLYGISNLEIESNFHLEDKVDLERRAVIHHQYTSPTLEGSRRMENATAFFGVWH